MSNEQNKPKILDIPTEIRFHEFDSNAEAPIWAVADCCQQAAGVHASMFGIGAKDLHWHGITWVLARQYFHFNTPIQIDAPLAIKTWPSAFSRASSHRDILLTDGNGNTYGKSLTLWVVMDIATRRMVRLPDFIKEAYPYRPDSEISFPRKKVSPLEDIKYNRELKPRRGDVDMNGHINNARYMEWALESLPDEIYSTWRLKALDISFMQEALKGDTIQTASGDFEEKSEDGTTLLTIHHSLSNADTDKECARVNTVWVKR